MPRIARLSAAEFATELGYTRGLTDVVGALARWQGPRYTAIPINQAWLDAVAQGLYRKPVRLPKVIRRSEAYLQEIYRKAVFYGRQYAVFVLVLHITERNVRILDALTVFAVVEELFDR